MKMAVIPKLYGNQSWKLTAAQHHLYDKIIFQGDYLDYGGQTCVNSLERLNNFKDILQFAATFPAKVVLLLGRNDFAYAYPEHNIRAKTIYSYRKEIEALFKSNKEKFKLTYQFMNYLFSNGYITDDWYKSVLSKIKQDYKRTYSTFSENVNSMLVNAELRRLLIQSGWTSSNNSRGYAGPLQEHVNSSELDKPPVSGFTHVISGPNISDSIVKLDIFNGAVKYQNTSVVLCNTTKEDDKNTKSFLIINM